MSATDRIVGVPEAARLLNVAPKTLYNWVANARIPYVKLGRRLGFRLSTLQRIIAAAEHPALDAPGQEAPRHLL
jgi:excisionase family DNA binding protein